jgi:hypothetical protein
VPVLTAWAPPGSGMNRRPVMPVVVPPLVVAVICSPKT